MKKTIICFLMIFFMVGIGVAGGKKPPSPEEVRGQLTPEKALEKAKEMWNNEKGNVEQYWQKIRNEDVKAEYDSILGPYFVVSQVASFNPGYLIFFMKNDGALVAEAQVDAYGNKSNDKIFIFPKAKGPDCRSFILDECSAKLKFSQKIQKKAIYSQMVFPSDFAGLLFISYLPAVWWLIDSEGSCYYMNFSGDVFSFNELLDIRNKRHEAPNVIYDQLKDPCDSLKTEKGGLIK